MTTRRRLPTRRAVWLSLVVIGAIGCESARPVAVAPHIDGGLAVDGQLDESWWAQTSPVVIDQDWAGKSIAPSDQTIVRLAWTDAKLLAGFECRDRQITPRNSERDGKIWKGDVVELFISGNSAALPYLELQINPDGAVFGAIFVGTKGKVFGRAFSPGWDAHGIETAVSRSETGWTVELALPWTEVPALSRPPRPQDRLRIQLNRYLCDDDGRPPRYHTTWSPPAPRQGQPHAPRSFGQLMLEPRHVPR